MVVLYAIDVALCTKDKLGQKFQNQLKIQQILPGLLNKSSLNTCRKIRGSFCLRVSRSSRFNFQASSRFGILH